MYRQGPPISGILSSTHDTWAKNKPGTAANMPQKPPDSLDNTDVGATIATQEVEHK